MIDTSNQLGQEISEEIEIKNERERKHGEKNRRTRAKPVDGNYSKIGRRIELDERLV